MVDQNIKRLDCTCLEVLHQVLVAHLLKRVKTCNLHATLPLCFSNYPRYSCHFALLFEILHGCCRNMTYQGSFCRSALAAVNDRPCVFITVALEKTGELVSDSSKGAYGFRGTVRIVHRSKIQNIAEIGKFGF